MNVFGNVVAAALAGIVASGALAQAAAPAGEGASAAQVTPLSMPRARLAQIYVNDPGCRPEYPAAAVRSKAQGISRVHFVVDAKGKLISATIAASSGPTPEHQLLDQAALETLSRCPFKPGMDASGLPIGTAVDVSYRWMLD